MKKLAVCLLSLCLIVAFSQDIEAQPWKKLKEKAKNATKGLKKKDNKTVKTTETQKEKEQQVTSNEQKPVNTNQEKKVELDPEFKKWFEKKYHIIHSNEYFMDIYSLEKATMQLEKKLEAARMLDYPNSVKIINEKKAIAEASVGATKVNWFLNYYKKKFVETFQNYLKPHINQKIEEAYKYKLKNKDFSINLMIEATQVMELAELVIPENAEVQELKKDVDLGSNDLLKDYLAKIYTSDFHKQNKNKVLFSKKTIDIKNIDPNQFTTEFTANDNIYAIVFLGGTINQLTKKEQRGTYNIEVDQGSTKYISFNHNPEDMEKTWYPIEIIPSKENAIHGIDAAEFGKLLSGLSPRKHTIKLTLGFGYSGKLASGEFTIDLTGMDAAKILANGEAASKQAKINWDKKRPLPDYVKTAKGQRYSSPELSEAKIKALIMNDYKDAALITKIVYFEQAETNEWIVRKNALGVPLEKISKRVCFVIYKGKDGWCYYIDNLQFRKPYLNGGKFGALERNRNDKPVRIDCKNCRL